MALSDEVKSRYPAGRLAQLTNPGASAEDTTTDATLDLAADDVEADFEIIAGVEYDNTDARHVSVAVEGVIAKLYMRTEAPGNQEQRHVRYVERLEALARVTGRDRILPKTTSVLTPSDEQLGSETVRPDHDSTHYDDYIPHAPKGGDVSSARTNN